MTVRASRLKRPLAARLQEDRVQQRRQVSSSPFFGTGIHPTGNGGMQSDDFDGDLDAGNVGTKGWAFNSLRVAIGELLLRPGSIGNDALANPVYPFVGHAQGNDFTLSTTNTAKATLTVPVPSGYTRAMVTAFAHVSAFNPTASGDYLYAVAWIQADTTIGWSMPTTIPAGESAHTSQTATALLTGLGASFTVKVATSTAYASFTTSTSGNVCNIDATVLFLR